MTFSASDAAFEGFRLVRRKPVVILWWSLAYLVFFGLFLLIAGEAFLALISQLPQTGQGAAGDPDVFNETMGRYGAVFALTFPVSLVYSAILSAAVSRAVLTPDASRFGYLRLGRDELRIGLTLALLWIAFFAVCFLGSFVIGLLASFVGVISRPAAILLGITGSLAFVAGLIWVAVRLSLAVPQTYATGKPAPFTSFAMTRGNFWPLLGMAVIAFMMTLLVALLGFIVTLPVQFMGGAAFDAAVRTGEMEQVLAAVTPGVAVGILINMVLSSLQLAVLYAPFSAAYRDLKGR